MFADPESRPAHARARERWGADPTIAARWSRPDYNVRAALPRLAAVFGYGVAMAYVEAAAVLYLRTLYGGIDPVGPRSPAINVPPSFVGVEVGREAAAMLMLASVGWLAGSRAASRLAAFLVAFGTWDIGYYAFLRLFTGWPANPFAPDILFLIPLPWWGPVIAPAMFALLMAVGGAAAFVREQGDGVPRPGAWVWAALLGGTLVCLVAFMQDALLLLPSGMELAQAARGGPFPWSMYLVGLVLAGVGGYRAVSAPAIPGR